MLVLSIGTGLYLTLRLSFPQIRLFPAMLRFVFRLKGGKRSITAVCNALGGTIGTGNVAGVATAICLGGPGAVFWMWIAAFLGMAVKYSEILLALFYQRKGKVLCGGPMYYMEYGLRSKFLAVLFSVSALLCTFGIGNVTQSQTITSIASSWGGRNAWLISALLALLCGITIFGGIKRIGAINQYLVPAMSIFYIIACFAVILLRIEKIPRAFSIVIQDAFSFRSVRSGFVGGGITLAIQNGFSKAIFSGEAGLGSAPMAHGAEEAENAAEQGLWGIFEVFVSTVLICTASALVILTSEPCGFSGVRLVIACFDQTLPNLGRLIVGVSGILFSFSSVIGWSYYGEVCIRYLSRTRRGGVCLLFYRVFFIVAVFLGGVAPLNFVWSLSEILNALMSIPNLIALILLSEKSAEMLAKAKPLLYNKEK